MKPRTSHVTTGSVKPRSSDGAFNQTKGFQICTDSDTSPNLALAIQAPAPRSRSRTFCRERALRLEHSRRCSIESPRRKKAFFAHASCTARTRARRSSVRGFASNCSCSGNQESLGNAETNQRLGMSLTPAMRIRCSLASPSEDSSEKGNQSLDFPNFATFVHTL